MRGHLNSASAIRFHRLASGSTTAILTLFIVSALSAQIDQPPPGQPTAPPPEPVRPAEILEQGGLVKPLECGPPPQGWPGLLGRPHGTAPVDLRLTPTSPFSADLAWKGAPWAVRHEVVGLNSQGQGSGVPGRCYAEWGLPLQDRGPVPGQRVVGADQPPALEAAPAAPTPTSPALQAMTDRVSASCYAQTYRLLVVAHYADSAPGMSEVVSFTTPAGPSPPPLKGLTVRAFPAVVELYWNALTGATAYRIYRSGALLTELLPQRYASGDRLDTMYVDRAPAAGPGQYEVRAVLSPCRFAPAHGSEVLSIASVPIPERPSEPSPREAIKNTEEKDFGGGKHGKSHAVLNVSGLLTVTTETWTNSPLQGFTMGVKVFGLDRGGGVVLESTGGPGPYGVDGTAVPLGAPSSRTDAYKQQFDESEAAKVTELRIWLFHAGPETITEIVKHKFHVVGQDIGEASENFCKEHPDLADITPC